MIFLFLFHSQSLGGTGIRTTDPRLAAMMKFLKQLKKDRGTSDINNLELGREAFKK